MRFILLASSLALAGCGAKSSSTSAAAIDACADAGSAPPTPSLIIDAADAKAEGDDFVYSRCNSAGVTRACIALDDGVIAQELGYCAATPRHDCWRITADASCGAAGAVEIVRTHKLPDGDGNALIYCNACNLAIPQ